MEDNYIGKEKNGGKSTVIAINGYLKLIKIVILKGFLCITLSIEKKCLHKAFPCAFKNLQ